MKLHNFDFSKKVFFHPEQIVDYKNGMRPFPVTIEVDLTNRCNHKCSFCFYAEHISADQSALQTEILKKRLNEAYRLGTKGISFTGGGEPTIHKDFVEILKYAKEVGLDCGLITNGSAITQKNVNDFINNLNWVRVSIGGGNKEIYKKVQGVDHFQRVIQNVRLLALEKGKAESNINIGVRVLVTEENINSLEELVNELGEVKINYIQLAPDMFTKDNELFWNSLGTQQIFKIIEEKLSKSGIMLLTAGYLKEQAKLDYPKVCYAHFFQAAITAEGFLTYCKNVRGEKKFYIGNINENTLEEIWESKRNKDLEAWAKPSTCGIFCKNMQLNVAMQDILHPDENMSPNFVS